MKNRAGDILGACYPLLDMLRAANKGSYDILWGV